jgi:uncharacterized protein YycO
MKHNSNLLGKVLLFKGGDPISWIVKVQSRSIYSHAALLIPGTSQCIESYPGSGVRIRELSAKEFERADIYDVRGMTPAMWEKAIEFARSQIGMGYDWWSVIRFVSKRPARENQRWFCSELVHKAISEAGIRLLERIPSAEVSPAHLAISPLLVCASDEPETVIMQTT